MEESGRALPPVLAMAVIAVRTALTGINDAMEEVQRLAGAGSRAVVEDAARTVTSVAKIVGPTVAQAQDASTVDTMADALNTARHAIERACQAIQVEARAAEKTERNKAAEKKRYDIAEKTLSNLLNLILNARRAANNAVFAERDAASGQNPRSAGAATGRPARPRGASTADAILAVKSATQDAIAEIKQATAQAVAAAVTEIRAATAQALTAIVAAAPKINERQSRAHELERKLMVLLAEGEAQNVETMTQLLGTSVSELASLLLVLEMRKVIRRLPGNLYEKAGGNQSGGPSRG